MEGRDGLHETAGPQCEDLGGSLINKEHPRGPPAKVLALDQKKALSHNKNLSLMRLRGYSKIF